MAYRHWKRKHCSEDFRFPSVRCVLRVLVLLTGRWRRTIRSSSPLFLFSSSCENTPQKYPLDTTSSFFFILINQLEKSGGSETQFLFSILSYSQSGDHTYDDLAKLKVNFSSLLYICSYWPKNNVAFGEFKSFFDQKTPKFRHFEKQISIWP